MFEAFLTVLSMSITAVPAILCVLLVRGIFLCRMPRKYAYFLWGVVFLRLICPVFLSSPFSLYHSSGMKSPSEVEKEISGRLDSFLQASDGEEAGDMRKEGTAKEVRGQENGSGELLQQKDFLGQFRTNGNLQGNGLENENAVRSQGELFENILKNRNTGLEKNSSSDGLSFSGDYPKKENQVLGKEERGASLLRKVLSAACVVWGIGVVLLLGWQLFCVIHFKRRLKKAVLYENNIYECENIPTPFVMGVLVPKIYLPFHMEEREREYILLHEKHHIQRRDYLIKLLALLLTCVYWFHPLVWISYFLMIRDMEMSCDEFVLKNVKEDIRKFYSRSLLGFAVNKRNMTMGVLAFGESDVERRVKNVLNFKKHGKWIGALAVVLILSISVICLTDAKTGEKAKRGKNNTADHRKNTSKNKNVISEKDDILNDEGLYERVLSRTTISNYEVCISYVSKTKIPKEEEIANGKYEGDFWIRTYYAGENSASDGENHLNSEETERMVREKEPEKSYPSKTYHYDEKKGEKNADSDTTDYTFEVKADGMQEDSREYGYPTDFYSYKDTEEEKDTTDYTFDTSRNSEGDTKMAVDSYKLSGYVYSLPTGAFKLHVADYDGDGAKTEFALGQEVEAYEKKGTLRKYAFFGVNDDGMIFHYQTTWDSGLYMMDEEISPALSVTNGSIEATVLVDLVTNGSTEAVVPAEKTELEATKSSDIGQLKNVTLGIELVLENADEMQKDKAGRRILTGLKSTMPGNVVEEIEKNGYITVSCAGNEKCYLVRDYGGEDHSLWKDMRIDCLWMGDRFVNYSCFIGGIADGLKEVNASEKKEAVMAFAKAYLERNLRLEDIVQTESDVNGVSSFTDPDGGSYEVWRGMVTSYLSPSLMKDETEIAEEAISNAIYFKNLDVYICPEWARYMKRVETGDENLGEVSWMDEIGGFDVTLRFWREEHAKKSYRPAFKKTGGKDLWSIIVSDGKAERQIEIYPAASENGEKMFTLEWEFYGVHFFMYAKNGEDYTSLAKCAAAMMEKWYKKM